MIRSKIKKSKHLFKALFLSFISTIVFLIITSILFRFTSLKESTLPLINNIIVIISIVLGSLYVSLKRKENGWINGALLGFFYYLFIIIINLISINQINIDLILLAKLMAASLTGAIAGIIGINLT